MVYFEQWCEENNIRDPFEVKDQIYDEVMPIVIEDDGSISCTIDENYKPENDPKMPSEIEIKAYCLLRDMFDVDEMLRERSYEDVRNTVYAIREDKAIQEYIDLKNCCEDCSGQCSLFCKKYGKCEYGLN